MITRRHFGQLAAAAASLLGIPLRRAIATPSPFCEITGLTFDGSQGFHIAGYWHPKADEPLSMVADFIDKDGHLHPMAVEQLPRDLTWRRDAIDFKATRETPDGFQSLAFFVTEEGCARGWTTINVDHFVTFKE